MSRIAKPIQWTNEMDIEIQDTYRRREWGGNKKLSRKFGISTNTISYRAMVLGAPPLSASTRICKNGWSKKEIELVKGNLDKTIAQIRTILARHGFQRSLVAVKVFLLNKQRIAGWPTLADFSDANDMLFTHDICRGMGVQIKQVQRWIEKGLLAARKGKGEMHLIPRRAFRKFLEEYPAHWDHVKADKWFLISVLSSNVK